jgi:hypothetical protein
MKKDGSSYYQAFPKEWASTAKTYLENMGFNCTAKIEPPGHFGDLICANWGQDQVFFVAAAGDPGEFIINDQNKPPDQQYFVGVSKKAVPGMFYHVSGHRFPRMQAFLVFACDAGDVGTYGDMLDAAVKNGAKVACGFVSEVRDWNWPMLDWYDEFWESAANPNPGERKLVGWSLSHAINDWNNSKFVEATGEYMNVRQMPLLNDCVLDPERGNPK